MTLLGMESWEWNYLHSIDPRLYRAKMSSTGFAGKKNKRHYLTKHDIAGRKNNISRNVTNFWTNTLTKIPRMLGMDQESIPSNSGPTDNLGWTFSHRIGLMHEWWGRRFTRCTEGWVLAVALRVLTSWIVRTRDYYTLPLQNNAGRENNGSQTLTNITQTTCKNSGGHCQAIMYLLQNGKYLQMG